MSESVRERLARLQDEARAQSKPKPQSQSASARAQAQSSLADQIYKHLIPNKEKSK